MKENIKHSIEQKRIFFDKGGTGGMEFRIISLRRLRKAISSNQERILDALAKDLGKPITEAYLSEVYFTLKEIDHTLKYIKDWSRPEKVAGDLLTYPSSGMIIREPYGLVLIIGPWNYPFQLVMCPLVSAVAAGNCAIVKPSEAAPNTSSLLKELISSAFDSNHVNVIEGDAQTAKELLCEKFDYIFYTGSAKVGRLVMEAASKNLTPVTLELGGKSPCIVDKNVRVAKAAKKIAYGKFFNAGQTCVAPDYVCAHKDIAAPFTEELIKAVKSFYGDNPVKSPDYGKIVNRRHFERLKNLLGENPTLIGQHDEADLKFAPALLRGASWEDTAMSEEIFGPILPIIEYSNLEAVISEINLKPKPLALYVFSKSPSVQNKIIGSVSAGGVCVNDTIVHITNLRLPFGGIGESGMGAYHGRWGFETFSHRKSVMKRRQWPDLFSLYPPYRDRFKTIKRFLK